MILENDIINNNEIIEKDFFNDEKKKIDHIIDEDNECISQYICKHSQQLTSNNLNNFIKEESYKNLKDNNMKNKIFFFSSFINSCKSYNNISEIRNDIEIILRNKIKNEDYYYNIIYNYLNSVLELIFEKNFFEEEKNFDELLIIIEKVNECLMNINNYYDIESEILIVEEKIIKILRKNNKDSKIIEKIIKIVEKNLNKKKKIDFHDRNESVKKNNNEVINLKKNESKAAKNMKDKKEVSNKIISNFDNNEKINLYNGNKNKNDYQNNNKMLINGNSNNKPENSKINNKNNINIIYLNKMINTKKSKVKKKKKHKKNKEEKKDIIQSDYNYNYENIMCPPIKNDDSD